MNNSDIVIFFIEKTQISCFNIDIDEQTSFLFLQKFVPNDPIEKNYLHDMVRYAAELYFHPPKLKKFNFLDHLYFIDINVFP